jgi:predicted small metal-binding protein
MKQFTCGSLVPGCDWHTKGQDEAEIVRRTIAHLRTAHDETSIRPNIIEQIKQRINEDSKV